MQFESAFGFDAVEFVQAFDDVEGCVFVPAVQFHEPVALLLLQDAEVVLFHRFVSSKRGRSPELSIRMLTMVSTVVTVRP